MTDNDMRQVTFGELQVGDEFKESPDGAWNLKIDATRGLWCARGMESTPQYRTDEMVWTDRGNHHARRGGIRGHVSQPVDAAGFTLGPVSDGGMDPRDWQPDVTHLVKALEQIERWDGFPSTGEVWEGSGEPVSYGAAFGSNGERDFMREVARKALAAYHKRG